MKEVSEALLVQNFVVPLMNLQKLDSLDGGMRDINSIMFSRRSVFSKVHVEARHDVRHKSDGDDSISITVNHRSVGSNHDAIRVCSSPVLVVVDHDRGILTDEDDHVTGH